MLEQPLENCQIQPLVAQREGQMTDEARLGFMAGRVEAPAVGRVDLVTWADGGKCPGQGRCERIGIDQRSIARRCGLLGEPALVKNGYGT